MAGQGCYKYEELVGRDQASLDSFWLRGERLGESGNLPGPGIFANEIVEYREAVLGQFRLIAEALGEKKDIQ